MNIGDLKVGDKAKILGYASSSQAYRQKLLAMGLTTNAIFTLKRIAPLGDPIEIEVRGFSLILRKKEAAIIRIEKIESCQKNASP